MSRELQTINQQNKLAQWAGRIQECRNSGHNVKEWCKENGICEQSYYKWQRKIFKIAKAQQEVRFAEITPVQPVRTHSVAVTVRLIDSGELCYLDVTDMNVEIWKQLIYHKNKWMSKSLKTFIDYVKENEFSN